VQVDFLNSLQGITNQFGSNYTAGGAQTATNTWESAKRLQQVARNLDRLTRGVQHPGAKYARLEMMEPFGSVGRV